VLIDTHCHLYFEAFDGDRAEALARMAEARVIGAVVIGLDPETNAQARALAAAHDGLEYSAGLHPVSEFPPELEARGFDAEEHLGHWWAGGLRPVAVGECGIDLHWDTNALEAQQLVFNAQLRFARERDLPVIVHSRKAGAATREALEQVPGARGVLHCFDGDAGLLEFALADFAAGGGWYVSFAGNLTHRRRDDLRQAARRVPAERLLVETDAPYQTPRPHRGQRNEPAFVVHTAALLAELRGMREDELQALLLSNSRRCFGAHW
jgi:TatD DNase family protein